MQLMPRSMKISLAWMLVALSAASIALMVWHVAVMMPAYGTGMSWRGVLPFFLVVSALPAGAAYAALKEKFGPSILLGILGFLFAGFSALVTMAGVGL